MMGSDVPFRKIALPTGWMMVGERPGSREIHWNDAVITWVRKKGPKLRQQQ